MPVRYDNLSGDLQSRISPDIGQTYYMVDSDYRTAAQGWSRADATGPLDLFTERLPGFVFRTGDHASDTVAMQAAIDAMIDFRGDVLYFTPGAYVASAATSVDVPDARWLGSPVGGLGSSARALITASASGALDMTAAADRMEVGFLRFVNPDSGHVWDVATGAANPYWHTFCWDEEGTTANAANQLLLVAGTWDKGLFENFCWYTGGVTGPMVEFDGTVTHFSFSNFEHIHAATGLLPIALLDIDGVGSTGISIGPGKGTVGAAGTVTAIVDIVDMTATSTNVSVRDTVNSVGYGAAATYVTTAGGVNDIDLCNCWGGTVENGAGFVIWKGSA